MTEAHVLALPDFMVPFQLETNALGSTMGVVLMQHDHPISFFSKPFCPRLLRSSTYVRKLHVLTSVVKKWWHYLLGHPFVIIMDHCSLKELMSQWSRLHNNKFTFPSCWDMTILYNIEKGNIMWLRTPFLIPLILALVIFSFFLCLASFSWTNYVNLFKIVLNLFHYWLMCEAILSVSHITTSIMIFCCMMARYGWIRTILLFPYFWRNTTLHPWEVIWDFPKLWHVFKANAFGKACVQLFILSFLSVQLVNRLWNSETSWFITAPYTSSWHLGRSLSWFHHGITSFLGSFYNPCSCWSFL